MKLTEEQRRQLAAIAPGIFASGEAEPTTSPQTPPFEQLLKVSSKSTQSSNQVSDGA